MHHALQIQEIFFNISGHCDRRASLASLARTCRAFKDPALDILWKELNDMFPLAHCLLEAYLQPTPGQHSPSRSLTQNDWENLRSYTCRIWFIYDFRRGLDEKSSRILLNPPTAEPLFPNLRHLYCKYKYNSVHLLHLPFPSLTSLDVNFKDPYWLRDSLESFSKFSPNIRNLSLVHQPDLAFSKLVSSCICRWRDLQTVFCPRIVLDVGALVHLSRMPALTELYFTLSDTLLPSESPLVFSNLSDFTVTCESLDPILRLLSWIRMSASADFSIFVDGRPSRRELLSFLVGVQTSDVGRTNLALKQFSPRTSITSLETLLLCFQDLQPLTALSNLVHLDLDIGWSVGLVDHELLELVSAWPRLECLFINQSWGWNSPGGITLGGLAQLLQKCRLLGLISLAIDTRGYIESPRSGGELADPELTLPSEISVYVLDSFIEAESVPAVASFFAWIARCSRLHLYAWNDENMVRRQGWEVYQNRWHEVYRLAVTYDGVGRHS